MKVKSESEIAQLCWTPSTPWTATHQAPPPMGFCRQEYWSGVPLLSPSPSSDIQIKCSQKFELAVIKLPSTGWSLKYMNQDYYQYTPVKEVTIFKLINQKNQDKAFANHIFSYN